MTEICNSLSQDTWYSTQALGWGLFAYMKYAESLPGDKNATASINVMFNGDKSSQEIGARKIWEKDLKITAGKNSLVVENTSGAPLYATLSRKGIPLLSSAEKSEKGLTMKVEYFDPDLNPVDQKSLTQGTSFMMVAKITNTTFAYVDNIALTEMVPSGWEIQNTRLFEAAGKIKESEFTYRDFRDDRVNTYFSLGRGETKTFVLMLTASYKGEFNQPSVWCEAMYRENCYARFPGGPVKVTGE